jgi:hypothetical protein
MLISSYFRFARFSAFVTCRFLKSDIIYGPLQVHDFSMQYRTSNFSSFNLLVRNMDLHEPFPIFTLARHHTLP